VPRAGHRHHSLIPPIEELSPFHWPL
jgi:hypothetical protein